MTAPLRVMHAGDSLVAGSGALDQGGSRRPFQQLMAEAGVTVEMVGSQHDAVGYHEGHPGWYISTLDPYLGPILPVYAPEVVLLSIGTNDCALNYDLNVAAQRIGELIDHIHAWNPETWVLPSLLPPGPPAFDLNVNALNALIPGVVSTRKARGARVGLVRGAESLTPAQMSSDHIHPGPTGYDRIAAGQRDAVLAALRPAGAIQTTTTQDGSVAVTVTLPGGTTVRVDIAVEEAV